MSPGARVRDALPAPLALRARTAAHRLPAAPGAAARAHARRALVGLRLAPPLGDSAAACNICGVEAEAFLAYGRKSTGTDGRERRCPGCGSLERHRMLWLYFARETRLFDEPTRLLHFAPERSFGRRLARCRTIRYTSADLAPGAADEVMDITAIPRPDASFDVVLANHVLEHVADDRLAMREVHRVLRPGGWAVLQVPMWGDATREDPTVTDPVERERRFGQVDHVRMYGHDGVYRQRLEEAGFDVQVVDYVSTLPEELVARHRLRSEDVYVCTRPT